VPVALAKALTASGKEYAETEIEYKGKMPSRSYAHHTPIA
jgi:hypothetical protein